MCVTSPRVNFLFSMLTTNLKRAFQFAAADFYRNRGISIAAIFILVITTLLITGLFYLHGMSSFLISEIENKIDIAAYFNADIQEQEILALKDDLSRQFEGISIVHVSKEEALKDFLQKHPDDSVLSKALGEVGENPFLPSLNITTNGDVAQYQSIAEYLQQEVFASFIEKVDFSQKRDTIEKILSITWYVNMIGIGLGVLLVIIATLAVFNTIKLVIDFSKDEIATMRIVGASNWFINAPFIIEGGMFGAISFAVCFAITLILSLAASRTIAVVAPGFSLASFFLSNLFLIIAIQFIFAVGLGVVSSFLAVRKYLKI